MSGLDADLIITGAGPAGLAAAQYGARANLKVLVIEQMAFGGQALLIDALENYPGNVEQRDAKGNIICAQRTGYELSMDFHRQAESFGASFFSGLITSLKKENDFFMISLADGEIRKAAAVIIATGSKPRLLDIPGEKEFTGKGVSYCAVCDGHFFRKKKIFVAGGGDAACDEARYLSRLTDQVTLIHRRDTLRAQKAIAERTLNDPNIKVRFNTVIREIKGDFVSAGRSHSADGAVSAAGNGVKKVKSVILADTVSGRFYEEEADAVFIFAGTVPQTSLVSGNGLKASLDEGGYIVTDQKMSTNIPGLFAAGDVRSGAFRQIVTAAADGAMAAKSAAEYIDEIRAES